MRELTHTVGYVVALQEACMKFIARFEVIAALGAEDDAVRIAVDKRNRKRV